MSWERSLAHLYSAAPAGGVQQQQQLLPVVVVEPGSKAAGSGAKDELLLLLLHSDTPVPQPEPMRATDHNNNCRGRPCLLFRLRSWRRATMKKMRGLPHHQDAAAAAPAYYACFSQAHSLLAAMFETSQLNAGCPPASVAEAHELVAPHQSANRSERHVTRVNFSAETARTRSGPGLEALRGRIKRRPGYVSGIRLAPVLLKKMRETQGAAAGERAAISVHRPAMLSSEAEGCASKDERTSQPASQANSCRNQSQLFSRASPAVCSDERVGNGVCEERRVPSQVAQPRSRNAETSALQQ